MKWSKSTALDNGNRQYWIWLNCWAPRIHIESCGNMLYVVLYHNRHYHISAPQRGHVMPEWSKSLISAFTFDLNVDHVIPCIIYKHYNRYCIMAFNQIHKTKRMALYVTQWKKSFNTLWPRDAIWRHRCESRLTQAMACCLTIAGNFLSQCWFIDSKV